MPPKRRRPNDGLPPVRPAPHRPAETVLGQYDRGFEGGIRGVRGGAAGGGRFSRRPDRRDSFRETSGSMWGSGPHSGPSSPTIQRPASSHSAIFAPSSANLASPALVLQPDLPASPPARAAPVAPGYDYTILTDDLVSRWAKDGRQVVLDHGVQSRKDEDITEVTTIFQELLYSVADGRVPGANAGAVVKDIIGPETKAPEDENVPFNPHYMFLDTLAIFMEVEAGEYRQQLRDFMIASEVSHTLMRQILEPDTLEKLGLIRNGAIFGRIGVRQSTNLLYRQANYNLLREESEGYSKLITEMYSSSFYPAHAETVKAVWETVKGLIGTFDLDVGRVQDITTDVYAPILIKNTRFYVKLLRCSSWWPNSQVQRTSRGYAGGLPIWALPDHEEPTTSPSEAEAEAAERLKRDVAFWDRARVVGLDAFFELGQRDAADPEEIQAVAEIPEELQTFDQKWIWKTKTRSAPGNGVAAQLLGFKLRYYMSDACDAGETLHPHLFYLASLLIKVGYISLNDLWAHLWPSDHEMDKVKEDRFAKLGKEEVKGLGGAPNALMTAGALTDDTLPTSSSNYRRDAPTDRTEPKKEAADEAANDKVKQQIDQKMHLLSNLLLIGALPECLFIIGRYPWILDAYPEEGLVGKIHRMLHHSLDKVFLESRCCGKSRIESFKKLLPSLDQSGVAKGSIKLVEPPPNRTLRWTKASDLDVDGQDFSFYWDDWADNIPVCQTVDDVFTLCSTLVNIIGVNIGQDPNLLTKLAAIGKKSLAQDASPENFSRWQDLLRRLLLPALSLTPTNCAAVSEVWDMLKQYPISVRYNLYAEWYEGQISRLEPIKKAFARTRAETLSTMKRLSNTNISQMARALAKTAFISPGVVFKVALQQIESYSNLIRAFVECAKYFTELGYDVLVWSVLSSLGGQQRSRTQADSVLLTSKWLQALSQFSGKVFQYYPNMDATPVLQYVNDQLFQRNSKDLVILKELMTSMGGVVSDADFTEAQLRAMTGGDALRREVLKKAGDTRHEMGPSARRLIRALVDTKLAGQLLINIAQHRQYLVSDDGAHIKYLATMIDDTHLTMVQYLDLLRSNLDVETFDSLVPDIIQLMNDYGLEVGLAFMIGRGSLRHHMLNPKAAASGPRDDQNVDAAAKKDTDAIGNDVIPMEIDTVNGDSSPDQSEKMDADDSKEGSPGKAIGMRKSDPLLAALQPVIEAITTVVPETAWKYLTPSFYVFFWSLHLGDLTYPLESYVDENKRLVKEVERIQRDRSDMSRAGVNRQNEKRRRILEAQQLLNQENKSGIERHSKVRIHLTKQVNNWFAGKMRQAEVDATADAVLEQCILPRLQLTALDSEYCFRMLKFLHDSQAPSFKLMAVYDRLFNSNRLRCIIFLCTIREAEHFGRFLRLTLSELLRWRGDKAAYEKEALGAKRNYVGFATTLDGEGKPTSFLEHDSFRDLLFRWHKNLNTALRSCLGGLEWMHIRNAITVLKSVMDSFPVINFMGEKFLDQLKTITDREAAVKGDPESEQGHRVDLSVLAQSAWSDLQKRKSMWMLVQAFRPGTTGGAQEDQQKTIALRATVSEFKTCQPKRASFTEMEDGEVKDGRDFRSQKKVAPVSTASSATATGAATEAATATATKTTTTPQKTAPANKPPAGSRDASALTAQRPTASSTSSRAAASLPVLAPSNHRAEGQRTTNLPIGVGRPDLPNKPNVVVDRFGQVQIQSSQSPLPHSSPVNAGSRREQQPPRDVRDPLPARDTRDARDPRAFRDHRDSRDVRDRDGRDPSHRDVHNPRDSPRDFRQDALRSDRPPPRDYPGPSDRRRSDMNARDAPRLPPVDRPGRTDTPKRGDYTQPAERDVARPPRDRTPQGPPHAQDTPNRTYNRDANVSPSPAASSTSGPGPRPALRAETLAIVTPTAAPPSSSATQHAASAPSGAPEPRINPERARLLAEAGVEITPSRAPLTNSTSDLSAARSPRENRDRENRDRDRERDRDRGRDCNRDRGDRDHERERGRVNDSGERDHEREKEWSRDAPTRIESPRHGDHPSVPGSAHVMDSARDDGGHGRHRSQREAPSEVSGLHGRGDRDGDRLQNDRGRESRVSYGGPPSRGVPDADRPSQQDPSYGRLNPFPVVGGDLTADPPSGPRGRGARNMVRADPTSVPPPPTPPPLGQTDGRFGSAPAIPASSPERHPPTGPAAGRNPRRAPFGDGTGGTSITSAMSTPVGGAAGYPDRARQVPGGVHPDRLNQITTPPALPPRYGGPESRQPHGPSPPAPPPLRTMGGPGPGPGPGPGLEYSGPSPTAPTGPAAGMDRIRASGRHHLNHIRTIAVGNQRNPVDSRRVSGLPRLSMTDSDALTLTGKSPTTTTPVSERAENLSPRDFRRRETSNDHGSRPHAQPIPVVDSRDTRSGPNGDEHTSGGHRGDHERSSRREAHHRSERSSRDRSPKRERETREPREYRDRGSAGGSGTPRGGREPTDRDTSGSSRRSMGAIPPPPGPPSGSYRDGSRNDLLPVNSGRSEGREHRDRRSEHRSGEEFARSGRTGRREEDRSRKRRSEGVAEPVIHRDKRMRP